MAAPDDHNRDPLFLLLRYLEMGRKTLAADEAAHDFGTAWPTFLSMGFLRLAAPARLLPCPDCNDGLLPIHGLAPTAQSATTLHLLCPDCGLVAIDSSQVTRYAIQLKTIVSSIAMTAGAVKQPLVQVQRHLWRLGLMPAPVRSKEAFVVTGPVQGRGLTIRRFFRRNPKAILLFPTTLGRQNWKGKVPEIVTSIGEFLSLQNGSLHFDQAKFGSALRDLIPAEKAKKRTARRAPRSTAIEKLEQEIEAHLVAARDYARHTRDTTGEPQLLPRPTQRELGRRLRFSESRVSNCLRDPKARTLKLLWETALNLDDILRWSPRSPIPVREVDNA